VINYCTPFGILFLLFRAFWLDFKGRGGRRKGERKNFFPRVRLRRRLKSLVKQLHGLKGSPGKSRHFTPTAINERRDLQRGRGKKGRKTPHKLKPLGRKGPGTTLLGVKCHCVVKTGFRSWEKSAGMPRGGEGDKRKNPGTDLPVTDHKKKKKEKQKTPSKKPSKKIPFAFEGRRRTKKGGREINPNLWVGQRSHSMVVIRIKSRGRTEISVQKKGIGKRGETGNG